MTDLVSLKKQEQVKRRKRIQHDHDAKVYGTHEVNKVIEMCVMRQLLFEFISFYRVLSVANDAAVSVSIHYSNLTGGTAMNAAWHASRGVASTPAMCASWSAANDVAKDTAIAAAAEAANARKCENARESAEEVARASCISAINDRKNIRNRIWAACAEMELTEGKFTRVDAVMLLRRSMSYDDVQFSHLNSTIPMQKMFIFYNIERMVRMIDDDCLLEELDKLIEKLGCTEKYAELFNPISTGKHLKLYLPVVLIDIVMWYCEVDIMSEQDEVLIVSRIIKTI